MATESPIRILEGTDKWSPIKQSNRYRPSSAKFAIEDLGLFFKSQSFHNFEIDVIPSRSESAPPSMEGSLAAIENIFPQRKSTLNSSGPLKLREMIPPTEFADSSMRFPTNSLPAHEEESEDDQSSEQSLSVPMEKASLCHKSEVDVSDNISSAGISDVSNSSNSETCIHKKQQIIPPNNGLQQQAGPQQDLRTAQIQGSYPQIIYPAINHAYGSLNQFHNGSSSVSSGFTHPLYATLALLTSPNPFYYQNTEPASFFTPQYSMGGYTFNSAVLPSYMGGYPVQGVVPVAFNSAFFTPSGNLDMQNVQKFYGQAGFPMQHFADPFQLQYIQPGVRESYGMDSHFGNQTPRNGTVSTPVSPLNSKNKEELVISSNNHKTQHLNDVGHTNLNFRNGNVSSNYSLGSPTNSGAIYPTGRYKMSHSHSSGSNPAKPYGFQSQSWSDANSYSFLEELKLGKGQRYELSDVAGYIGEFSVDQHGSRFIQQKLETCSVEEKVSVFKEVLPHTPRLMTDVFGNYVIQKLFEYGSPKQRKDLANQLGGQILALSLQMYGCRVIQKALEVIDLDQKTRLVRELDGHVTRCVRDQNGNHVIQKCIESLPSGNIDFILSSFRGQVATLSMHPYGCRVIQRVLEHCNDESQMQFIVDEILDSVCLLAQDQYGNYVTQHVLEKGKTRERREIIEKLSRSIVQLSQHKFASNVIEKCLEYSDSTARDVLLNEIVSHGDTNDNLWIMMKDQYANYVIQKILQKCSNEQRVMLLGLIRSHLTALKKYTHGKHIAARFKELYGEEIQSIGS